MGIGAALVELLYSADAHVFFGDVESAFGEHLSAVSRPFRSLLRSFNS